MVFGWFLEKSSFTYAESFSYVFRSIFLQRALSIKVDEAVSNRKVISLVSCDMDVMEVAASWHKMTQVDFYYQLLGLFYRLNSISVLLAMAFERYIYVCWGTAATSILTPRRCKIAYTILTIVSVSLSFFYYLEEALG